MTVYEAACTHKWDFNQAGSGNVSDSVGGLTATNSGATSTAAVNGAYDYAFITNDSMTMGTNTIGISSGDFTIEVIASITIATTGEMMSRFNSIATKNWGWEVYFYTTTKQMVFDTWENNNQHAGLGSSKTDWTNNKVYHFFITGAPAGGSNNYTMYWMNGTTPTSTAQATYAGSPDESQSINLYFGRRQDTAFYLSGGMYLVRIHNAVLTSQQMTDNYNAEGWRYGAVDTVAMPVRNCTTAAGAVTTTKSSTITMPVPNCTTAAGAVTVLTDKTVAMSCPGCTTATGAVVTNKSSTLTMSVPTCTTAAGAITVATAIPMSVPNCTTETGAVTTLAGKLISMPVPNCTTATGAVTVPLTQVITMPVPGCTTATDAIIKIVTPTMSAPGCTTAAGSVEKIVTAMPSAPGCTTATGVITKIVTPTMSVPGCTTATDAVYVPLTQNLTLTAPDCTTATGAILTTLSILLEITVVPDCYTTALDLIPQSVPHTEPAHYDITEEWPIATTATAEYPTTYTPEVITYPAKVSEIDVEWPISTSSTPEDWINREHD